MNGKRGRNKSLILKFKATAAGFTANLPCPASSWGNRGVGRACFLFTVRHVGPERGNLEQEGSQPVQESMPQGHSSRGWRGCREKTHGARQGQGHSPGGSALESPPRNLGKEERGSFGGQPRSHSHRSVDWDLPLIWEGGSLVKVNLQRGRKLGPQGK